MHLRFVLFFMTFVLCAAKPAPSPELGEEIPSSATEGYEDTSPVMKETVSISKAPPDSSSKEERTAIEYFHPHKRALTIRGGLNYGLSQIEDRQGLRPLVGILFKFETPWLVSFETGADLISDGTGTLHLSWIRTFSRSATRPFAKAGMGVRIVPADQLVTVLRPKHYQVRVAGGLERTIFPRAGARSSLRAELETWVSLEAVEFVGTAGYVWSW